MSLNPILNGHYDDNGIWQRFKHCLVSCAPPDGQFILTDEELEDNQTHIN